MQVDGEVSRQTLILQLSEVLKQHCASYEDLCVLLSAQIEALKENDISRLQMLLASQDEMVMRIGSTEERRAEIQSELAAALDGVEVSSTLGEILESEEIPTESKESIFRIRDRLADLTARVKELNEQNREMVSEALKFIAYLLDGFHTLAKSGNTYADEDSVLSLLMDRKV